MKPGYPERTSVVAFVGAASSRDRFNSRLEAAPTAVDSRLEAAPTAVFLSYLSLPDKGIMKIDHYLRDFKGECQACSARTGSKTLLKRRI